MDMDDEILAEMAIAMVMGIMRAKTEERTEIHQIVIARTDPTPLASSSMSPDSSHRRARIITPSSAEDGRAWDEKWKIAGIHICTIHPGGISVGQVRFQLYRCLYLHAIYMFIYLYRICAFKMESGFAKSLLWRIAQHLIPIQSPSLT